VHIPKISLSSHAQILQNKPDAVLVLVVDQAEGASCKASYQVPGKHALGLAAADGKSLGHAKRGVKYSWGMVPRALRCELRDSLDLRAELVRIVLVWCAITCTVLRRVTCSSELVPGPRAHERRQGSYLSMAAALRMGLPTAPAVGTPSADRNQYHDLKARHLRRPEWFVQSRRKKPASLMRWRVLLLCAEPG
jgi:hypothetical protein